MEFHDETRHVWNKLPFSIMPSCFCHIFAVLHQPADLNLDESSLTKWAMWRNYSQEQPFMGFCLVVLPCLTTSQQNASQMKYAIVVVDIPNNIPTKQGSPKRKPMKFETILLAVWHTSTIEVSGHPLMKDIFHHIPVTFEKIPGTAPWKPLNDAILFQAGDEMSHVVKY